MQAHHGAFGVAPGGGDGAAGALFRQHGGAVRDRVTVFHHPAAPQGRELPVKGGRAAGEVVREVVAAELRRVPGRFPKCFRGQQENRTPFIKIGAPYHRRGMGACEGVPWKSRSAHGGSGRFVARGRASDRKNFFQRRAGRLGGWAETLLLQGVQGSAAQRGAVQKSGGALGRTDCSCEADEIMLT